MLGAVVRPNANKSLEDSVIAFIPPIITRTAATPDETPRDSPGDEVLSQVKGQHRTVSLVIDESFTNTPTIAYCAARPSVSLPFACFLLLH